MDALCFPLFQTESMLRSGQQMNPIRSKRIHYLFSTSTESSHLAYFSNKPKIIWQNVKKEKRRNFVFSLEDCRRVGSWGGWSGVLSNELYKMGTAKLKWEETDLPPNMNTRKMQMYQQWIYYSEYVGKQKALESRVNENELLPSALCCRRKNERKSGEKEKERMIKREIQRGGYEKSREWGGKKNPGPCYRLFFFFFFFFKQWHPVFLDVSLLWQL